MTIHWPSTAYMFPGQASQEVGMGKDIAEAYTVAHDTFLQADDILGMKISDLCFNGPEDELNDTINTQPALFVCGIATLRALQAECPEAVPGFVAGHSLGEFTALTAAGAITFEDGLRLVRERGRLMKQAGTRSPGAMAAVLGIESDAVRAVCQKIAAETGGVLILANDNCPGQTVISGDNRAIEAALPALEAAGARRAVKLAVSIAAHSPLMESASADFRNALTHVQFRKPHMPVYANVTAVPLTDVESIREELDQQLTHSVLWTDSIRAMIGAGASTFVEIGPKDVLAGLLKRISRDAERFTLNNVENLRQFIAISRQQ